MMLRRRNLMVSKGELPIDYVSMYYIESTGTQYINTGFSPNQDTRVVCDFEIISLPTKTDYHTVIFGARSSANAPGMQFAFSLRRQSGNNGFRGDYYNTRNYLSTKYTSALNRYIVDQNKNVISFNNETITTNYISFNVGYPLYLFSMNTTNSTGNNMMGRIYSCQIYDNGNLVRNFIPCINPSGEIGMYDTVGKAFYGNAGTGEFVAGYKERQ